MSQKVNLDAATAPTLLAESESVCEAWKRAALDLRANQTELTTREVAERVGVEFQRLKNWLAREKKKSGADPAAAARAADRAVTKKTAGTSQKRSGAATDKAYEQVRIPGRGWGMVATRDIQYGELLLEERPVITLRNHSTVALSGMLAKLKMARGAKPNEKAGDLPELEREFTKLTPQEQAAVMDLHDATAPENSSSSTTASTGLTSTSAPAPEQKTLGGIFRSNCFARGVDDGGMSVLCLEASRFNHSCVQNVSHAFADPYERIYACRDIKRGEELCTCYCDPTDAAATRGRELKFSHGFECDCEACALPEREREAADRRRAKYKGLDEKIATVGGMDPRRGLELVGEAFETLEREKLLLPALISRHAYDGYQLACGMRNLLLAKKWIARAHAAQLIENGPDHETTTMYAGFLKNPKSHQIWR